MNNPFWLALFVFIGSSLLGCQGNLFESLSEKDSEAAKIEEIKIKLDNQDYEGASEIISDMDEDERQSDEVALLQVAVILGEIRLSVWDVIKALLEEMSGESAGAEEDAFQSVLNGLLGESTEERNEKYEGLETAIELLLSRASAASSYKVQNTACFVGIIMLAATLADSTQTIDQLRTEVQQVSSLSSNNVCSVADEIEQSLALMAQLTDHLSLISRVVQVCPFLQEVTDDSIAVQLLGRMQSLKTTADQGCSVPQGLQNAPACIQTALGTDDDATAGDDEVAGCELATNCLYRSCF